MCGKIQAHIGILTLIDQIDLHAREIDEHSRKARPAVTDPGKRDLTFFGSHWWDWIQRTKPTNGGNGMAGGG